MSREVAGSTSSGGGLLSELAQTHVYKRTQGRLVRQITALVIGAIVAFAGWRLYAWMRSGGGGLLDWRAMPLPALVLAAGWWFAYRLVNWPRFADFLIAVEGELAKVSWPSRTELVRASMVVIFTMFFLALMLFGFDLVWRFIFETLGVIQ